MKMYKWFVWSSKLQRYLAISGLFPFHRGEYDKVFTPGYLEEFGCSLSFSIPFFESKLARRRRKP